MREVYIVGVARLPFTSVSVGMLNSAQKDAARRAQEIDIPKLEAETGLIIRAEWPKNKSSYSGISPHNLALIALGDIFRNFKLGPEVIDVFRLGSVISHKTDESTIHAFAKVIALRAGMIRANTLTLDKACSSALMSVGFAVDSVRNGGADFAIGGGVEKMSDVPDRLVRFGLTNPFDGRLMAALADEVAKSSGLTRTQLDDYAFESCERARAWQGLHRYITPVRIAENEFVAFDEEVNRRPTNRKVFARAWPYPQSIERADSPKCELITPANSAQYADGCGMALFASGKMVRKYNLRKLAKVLAFAEVGGNEPKNFILKPEQAIQKALNSAGMMWTDIGHFEVNEAFAAGNVLLMKTRTIERARMNRRGGAIAHGHSIGATGAALLAKEIDILETDKQRYGIVSVCNAVDEATAILLENPYA